jgi:hypothetical protein
LVIESVIRTVVRNVAETARRNIKNNFQNAVSRTVADYVYRNVPRFRDRALVGTIETEVGNSVAEFEDEFEREFNDRFAAEFVVRSVADSAAVFVCHLTPPVHESIMSAMRTVIRLLLLLVSLALTSGSLCHNPNPHVDIECITPSDSMSYNPWIACDASGHLVLAWTRNVGGREDVWYVEKDSGGDWSQPVNLSQSGGEWGSRNVSLCHDRGGTLHAAWSQSVGLAWVIFYTRRVPNGSWAVPETIVHGIAVRPSIGVDSAGSVHLLFEDFSYGFDVCYARRDPTAGWGPVSVLHKRNHAGNAALGVRPDGRCLVAYDDLDSARTYWRSCRGDTWTSPMLLDSASITRSFFAMAAQGGTVYFAQNGGRNHMWIWTYRDETGWVGPDSLCPQGHAPSMISLAALDDSVLAIGWEDARSSKLRVARRASRWSIPVEATGADSTHPTWRTSLAVAPDGLAHLAWAGPSAGSSRIYYTSVRME